MKRKLVKVKRAPYSQA